MVYKAVDFLRNPPAMRSPTALVPNVTLFQTLRATVAMAGLLLGVSLVLALPGGAAHAQSIAKAGTAGAPQAVPGFWDPRRRPERPDLSRLTVIRFLTETDYPPFNFTGPDGNPAGFNVDLARLLCEEIKVTCTVQMRRFETLLDAIASNRGDAIIASLAVTPQLRARVDFTDPYYRAPARFVSRRDAVMPEVRPEYLARSLPQGDVHGRRTAFLSQ
jgi:polar amino acid transport system substrate-binding protein